MPIAAHTVHTGISSILNCGTLFFERPNRMDCIFRSTAGFQRFDDCVKSITYSSDPPAHNFSSVFGEFELSAEKLFDSVFNFCSSDNQVYDIITKFFVRMWRFR